MECDGNVKLPDVLLPPLDAETEGEMVLPGYVGKVISWGIGFREGSEGTAGVSGHLGAAS
jgi:hypothetical protein